MCCNNGGGGRRGGGGGDAARTRSAADHTSDAYCDSSMGGGGEGGRENDDDEEAEVGREERLRTGVEEPCMLENDGRWPAASLVDDVTVFLTDDPFRIAPALRTPFSRCKDLSLASEPRTLTLCRSTLFSLPLTRTSGDEVTDAEDRLDPEPFVLSLFPESLFCRLLSSPLDFTTLVALFRGVEAADDDVDDADSCRRRLMGTACRSLELSLRTFLSMAPSSSLRLMTSAFEMLALRSDSVLLGIFGRLKDGARLRLLLSLPITLLSWPTLLMSLMLLRREPTLERLLDRETDLMDTKRI